MCVFAKIDMQAGHQVIEISPAFTTLLACLFKATTYSLRSDSPCAINKRSFKKGFAKCVAIEGQISRPQVDAINTRVYVETLLTVQNAVSGTV